MKQKQITNMTCMSAIEKLKQWSAEYMSDYTYNINIIYDKDRFLCTGVTQYDDNGIPMNVNVGIAPLTTTFPARYRPITDSDFVKMGVTTFHELTHCKRSLSDTTSKEIRISDLSKCYNEDYYYTTHHKLPHEIDAEFVGIMSMWSALENEWPDDADRLMFDYLDYRTEKSGNVIKKPHDLLYLWNEASSNRSPTIYTIFEEYDCIVGSNICSDMNNFIVWLDDFEKSLDKGHKGENPYRYLLYPYNKILNTELYIDVNFLSEYIMKFLSIIEIMIFEYIKKVPKWNEKCVRWDNTHFEVKVWDSYIANNI